MELKIVSEINTSFGYKGITKNQPTTRKIIAQITNPIRTANNQEKIALSKALGLSSETLKTSQTQFESHGGDIIGGEILPNIHATSSGVSYIETVGNIVNVELARIRGQLKKVSLSDLNL